MTEINVNGNGTWNAVYVPVSVDRAASFDLQVIPAGGSSPVASTNREKPKAVIKRFSPILMRRLQPVTINNSIG